MTPMIRTVTSALAPKPVRADRAARLRAVMLVLLAWAGPALAQTAPDHHQPAHLLQAAQPANAPEEVMLAVEIPAGSRTKYEIGPDGLIRVDRFLAMPVAYPANYGSIPRSLAGDADPLDALVLTREPLHPGTLIRFRPIGVLRMTDAGAQDDKIIGVPADSVDPAYARIRDIDDLDPSERDRIRAFFEVYKRLPEPATGDLIELAGFDDAKAARAIIATALETYSADRRQPPAKP